MFIHLNVWLLFLLTEVWIHQYDLLLKIFIFFSQLILFSKFLFDSLDKILFHLMLSWKLSDLSGVLTIFLEVTLGIALHLITHVAHVSTLISTLGTLITLSSRFRLFRLRHS